MEWRLVDFEIDVDVIFEAFAEERIVRARRGGAIVDGQRQGRHIAAPSVDLDPVRGIEAQQLAELRVGGDRGLRLSPPYLVDAEGQGSEIHVLDVLNALAGIAEHLRAARARPEAD